MELTRYWRAQHKRTDLEVQWTGLRFSGGWILRLLVDGKVQAESRSFKDDIVINGETRDGPVNVHFRQGFLRNRCAISVDGTVLIDSAQPWNLLGFACFLLACVGAWEFIRGFVTGLFHAL